MKLQRRLAVVNATSILATGLVAPAFQAAEQNQQANNPVTTRGERQRCHRGSISWEALRPGNIIVHRE
jgi:hypothetical protein